MQIRMSPLYVSMSPEDLSFGGHVSCPPWLVPLEANLDQRACIYVYCQRFCCPIDSLMKLSNDIDMVFHHGRIHLFSNSVGVQTPTSPQ